MAMKPKFFANRVPSHTTTLLVYFDGFIAIWYGRLPRLLTTECWRDWDSQESPWGVGCSERDRRDLMMYPA